MHYREERFLAYRRKTPPTWQELLTAASLIVVATFVAIFVLVLIVASILAK